MFWRLLQYTVAVRSDYCCGNVQLAPTGVVGINWSVTAATPSSHNSLVSAESRPALWFDMGLSREQVEQHIAGVQKRLGSETEVGYYLIG